MVVKPVDLTVLELALVVLREIVSDYDQLPRDLALGQILVWPVTAGQDFCREFNAFNIRTTAFALSELRHHLLRLNHVLEHRLDLVDCIVAALNLKLLDHQLLCLI